MRTFSQTFTFFFTITMATTASTAFSASTTPKKVIVTGAGGQTGQILFRKMLALPEEFAPVGLVRTEASKQALLQSQSQSQSQSEGATAPIPESCIEVVDVTDAEAVRKVAKDCSAFCICTSAKPKPTGIMNEETGRPVFGFPNGSPEEVDWIGQKNQIDAVGNDVHVVICSSMGGTDPNHMLNSLGRTNNADGTTSGGNILKWKRKAEMYLIDSGRPYTIVHPGGLIDEEGGERELVFGVNDSTEGTDSRTVPRADVAEVMLQSIREADVYAGKSFDLRAKPVEEGKASTDFRALVQSLDGKIYDYSLGEVM